jgi:hypothetical protein
VEDGLEAPDEPATPGELPPNGSAGDETEIDQGTTGGSTGSSTPPASATPDSTVDTVEDLASGGSQSPGPQVAPVLLPDSEEFRSLQEDLEELGLLAGASSVELLDNPQGPTLRVQYGFGVLQFLVSSMYDWLPRN